MREIKFRAWHKKLKQVLTDKDWHHYGPVLVGGKIESDDHEIMQYTGLKDKLGKEIYEGDILEATGGELESKPGKSKKVQIGTKLTVKFHEGAFRCCKSTANRKLYLNSANIRLNGLCVIGKIYENK